MAEAENSIYNPKIPYISLVPGGVQAGKVVVLKGVPLWGSVKRFSINFTSGLLVDGDHKDNIPFHFNPRFNEQEVVCNTLINNKWGQEERWPNPFSPDIPFEIRILILTDIFKVAVNGRHLLDYKHRTSVNQIKTIYIEGSVHLDLIQFEGDLNPAFNSPYASNRASDLPQNPGSSNAVHPAPPGWAPPGGQAFAPPTLPFIKPPVPFEAPLPDNLRLHQQIFVTGSPHNGADRFEVNFKIGEEIAFHFNPRFRPRFSEDYIVRNTFMNGKWGKEEEKSPNFPFLKGGTFDLIFVADHDGFKVAVNGQHFLVYEHRMPFQKIDKVQINGDVKLLQVHIQ